MTLSGLFTAHITPFCNGTLDEAGFVANLDRQEVDGAVVLGSTGEANLLTTDEKWRVIELAAERTKTLIVGCATGDEIEMAHHLGADYAMVHSPCYIKPPQAGLIEYFTKLHDDSPIPLMIYNHPGRTGVNLSPHTLYELSQLPRIVAIKEANSSMEHIIELLSYSLKATVLSGNDALTLPMMALGAQGVISVASNLEPQKMYAFVHAMLNGSLEEARSLFYTLKPLFDQLELETNPIPIKALMNKHGLAAGQTRAPLIVPEENLCAALSRS